MFDKNKDVVITKACAVGNIKIFESVIQEEIPPNTLATIQREVQKATTSDENYFTFLKHLALKHKMRFTFDCMPRWANRQVLQWMQAQGFINFDQSLLEKYLENEDENYKIEVIKWFLEQGGVITPRAIQLAAPRCHLHLLDFLWEHRPNGMVLESTLAFLFCDKMSEFPSVLPFRRSVRWLMSKGCTWGTSPAEYNQFLKTLIKEKPRFTLDFMAEFKIPYGPNFWKSIPAAVREEHADTITALVKSYKI